MTVPLIVGAGPAGSTAAIILARAGAKPLLMDRDSHVRNALCGGFLSWRTAETLRRHAGCDVRALGANSVTELALFTRHRAVTVELPGAGYGLSRHSLDRAMRNIAVAAGASLTIDRVREINHDGLRCDGGNREHETIFLACGKHDIRGVGRPRAAKDPALGLRLYLSPQPRLKQLIGNRIELHFFRGGYAGIVLQEDGSANVCLAVRKSLLKDTAGDPATLLERLGCEYPHFGERMQYAGKNLGIDTIAAVPYGWIARRTRAGLFRIGDQAAVIPSLAGEGMGIAIASGLYAARAWLHGGADAAPSYQRTMARRCLVPVSTARTIWRVAETGVGATVLASMAGLVPTVAGSAMRATRLATT